MNNYVRDPIFGFRSYTKKKTGKTDEANPGGWDMHNLYLDQDKVAELIQTLSTLQDNPAGVKFNVQIKKRQNTNTGHLFDSAYMFVGATQNQTDGNTGVTQGQFVPKVAKTEVKPEVTAKINQLKEKGIAK